MMINETIKERLNVGEMIVTTIENQDGTSKIALIVKDEYKKFKKIKYNPVFQLKTLMFSGINSVPLVGIFLKANMDKSTLYDSWVNYHESDEARNIFDLMAVEDNISVIFINSDDGSEKIAQTDNDLKEQFQQYLKVIEDYKSYNHEQFIMARNTFKRQYVYNDVLWNSPLMNWSMNFGFENVGWKIDKRPILNGNIISFAVLKNEVEDMNFERLEEVFKVFKQCGKKAMGKLMITFSGYINNPLEIYEIEEIRQYVQALFDMYENLFYYISDEDNNNRMLFLCLADTDKIYTDGINAVSNVKLSLNSDLVKRIYYGARNYAKEVNDKNTSELEYQLSNMGVPNP